jgi:hypothetical protein
MGQAEKAHAMKKRTNAMFSKLALSAALALGTASAALAATKHHVRQEQTTVQKQVTPGYNAYNAYGYEQAPRGGETYIGIQDRFFRESN